MTSIAELPLSIQISKKLEDDVLFMVSSYREPNLMNKNCVIAMVLLAPQFVRH